MLTVSNYHYIRNSFETKFPSIFGLTASEFDSQLKMLKNTGEFISPNDFVLNSSEVLKSKDNLIMITFDDGLLEQFEYAVPILENHDIPALFFANSHNSELKQISLVHKIHLLRSVVNGKILLDLITEENKLVISKVEELRARQIYIYDDEKSAVLKYILNFKLSFEEQKAIIDKVFNNYFDNEEVFTNLYMTNQQLIYLSKKGFLGSHAHSHQPLGLLDDKMITYELQHSKSYFEALTKTEIPFVSYPYGTKEAVTKKVTEIAKDSFYLFGFTVERGLNVEQQNPFSLKRFDCNDVIGGKNYK